MFMCVHVYDVDLCGNTVKNVGLGLLLFGHPWYCIYACCKALAYISNENRFFDALDLIACKSFISGDSIFYQCV